MAHDHAHPHALDHGHADNERCVFWAMLLTGGFMLAEVVGGVLSGSLALLADAGHMLTDAVLHRLQCEIAERFGVRHATIQVERIGCADHRHEHDEGTHDHPHPAGAH